MWSITHRSADSACLWEVMDRVSVRQPQPDTSSLADLGGLAQVKQEASWEAAERAWGG
jgi:hypothetical protein